MISVVLCSESEEFRLYFEHHINAQEDMSVVVSAKSVANILEFAALHNPDVILLDVHTGETDGIFATKEIAKTMPDSKIIIIAPDEDDELPIECYSAGAVDYLVWGDGEENILNSIRNAYANEFFVGRSIAHKVQRLFEKGKSLETGALFYVDNMTKLTNRERIILHHLYEGKKRRKIAQEEFSSEETVKFHIRNILKKTGFASVSELVRFLKQSGIMEKFSL